ncbi:MAG: hypothetical protein DDG59_08760 [Anaerolineae bacterium]|jgi:hypothetical protein|nr:MAG: hypothetical protein DDG59_08760 [Anaerolineae bacterium]
MTNGYEAVLNNLDSPPNSAQLPSERIKWLSLGQALATALVVFLLFNLSLGLLLYSFLQVLSSNADQESAFSMMLLASGLFTVGLLLIPSVLLAFSRFFGWKRPTWFSSLRLPWLAILLLAYPPILLAGNWLSKQSVLAFLLLPFFHIAAIGLPIAAILQIGLRGLDSVSHQRKWGALSVGLTLSPFLIFILELFAFILPIVLLAVWVSQDPERLSQFSRLSEILRQPLADPQMMLNELQPYLSEAAVVFTLLFFAALIVPLIEEAIKPLGVWLLYGRTRGALDGFVSGALCGAGYALLESFLLGSSKSDWLFAVLGRSGTGTIHIFTSALIGAALTTAWQRQSYLRLSLAYLIGVFFHGVWNGFIILAALRGISDSSQGFWSLPLTQNLATIAPFAILLLAALAVLGLWGLNQQIRKEWSTIGSISVEG